MEPVNQGAQSWSWHVPFTVASVTRMRGEVTKTLLGESVAPGTVDDARVVLTELMGNAVRHARAQSDGDLTVRLALDDESVRLCVVDGGSTTLPALVNPPELAPSGRGLTIVRTLTSDWGVREAPNGNTVFGVLQRR